MVAADLGGYRADELLVAALDLEAGALGHGDLDAIRDVHEDRVGVPEREVELLALQVGLESDALDLELLKEAGRSRPSPCWR